MPRVPMQRRAAQEAGASFPEGTSRLGGRQLPGSLRLSLAHVDALASLAMFCQLDGAGYAASALRAIAERLGDELAGRSREWTIAFGATVALNLRRHRAYMDARAVSGCEDVVTALAGIGGARIVDPVAFMQAGPPAQSPRVPFVPKARRRAELAD